MDVTRYLPFAGRVLLGLPFAMSGLGKLTAFGPTTEMIGTVGLHFPVLAYAVAVAVELGGGLLLIAGFRTRFVALELLMHGRRHFEELAISGLPDLQERTRIEPPFHRTSLVKTLFKSLADQVFFETLAAGVLQNGH